MRDTRNIIAEQAQRILNGGTPIPDTEVKVEELEIYVDQAFSKYIKNSWFENKNEGSDYVNGTFIYSFVSPVDTDTIRNRKYAKIPSTYVNLPNGIGLYQVSPTQDEFNSFIPVNANFLAMTSGLPVGNMEGRKGYFVENTKIYFVNIPDEYCFDNVLIKLVGGIQADDDQDIDISSDMQADLVAMTVELYKMQQMSPKDYVIDNNKQS